MSHTLAAVTNKTIETVTVERKIDLAEFLLTIYPVGSIYTSTVNTDPSILFGGVWESIGGRFLLSADATYTAGSTGGEASHTLTVAETPSHNHTTDEQGSHTHTRGTMEITGTWYAEGMMRDIATPVVSGALYTHTFSAISGYAYGGASYPLSKGIGFQASKNWTGATSSNGAHTHTISNVGSGQSHNYMWKRIA